MLSNCLARARVLRVLTDTQQQEGCAQKALNLQPL
jgi:hypothetical protein